MVRNIKELEAENEKLEQLIKKKENEITKAENKIQRNRDLISKKREIQDRTISAHVVSYEDRLTTIRIIDTGETHSYWGHSTPGTYIKITPKWLEQLRDTKRRRDNGEFER